MATLKVHGDEIGRIEKLTHTLCFMSDGKVLRNDDNTGWKRWRRVRDGVTPTEAFKTVEREYAEQMAKQPMFAYWKDTLHSLVPKGSRKLVVTAVAQMPSDPDGVKSDLEDIGWAHLLSTEDCVKLCDAYRLAQEELKTIKRKAKK